MNIKFVLLDICNTTVNIETADKFIEFVLKKTNRLKLLKFKILSKIIKTKVGYHSLKFMKKKYKFETLKLLKNLKREILEDLSYEFFKKILKPNYNLKTVKFLEKYPNSKVIIVSGGYDIYLKHLAKDLNIPHLVCSKLKFTKNIFSGELEDLDCIGINKVILLDKYGYLKKIIFEHTAVLSDSISDLPLFSLGKYKIAVNPDKELSKLINKGWLLLNDL